MRLYHVSDQPGIARFEPRPSPTPHPSAPEPVVWAVADRLVHNYLLLRDAIVASTLRFSIIRWRNAADA